MVKTALLLVMLLMMTGCSNPWEQAFAHDTRYELVPLEGNQSVDIRSIEWQRWANYVAAESQRRTVSSVADVDLPATQKVMLDQNLLETIQLASSPSSAVLGISEFSGWADVDPHGGQLRDFAKKIGADTVVTTSQYVGHDDRVRHENVDSFSSYSRTANVRVDGRYRQVPVNGTESTSTQVPVVVREPRYNYVAVFVRRR